MNQHFDHTAHRSESGFVAIFSVIFFALLALVITIGFVRVVNVEQQQALNNDLTARALAAAEAGVEDAKRAIYYYSQLPEGEEKDLFREALNSDECNVLFRNGSIVAQSIGLNPEGRVADDQNLFYTCLTVNLDTSSYLKTLAKDQNHVIPLRSKEDFNRVTLEWHLNSDTPGANGDGIPNNYQPPRTLPLIRDFENSREDPPAYMRAQLIGVPRGEFNREDLNERSRTVFLAPYTSGGNQLALATADPRGFNQNKSSPFQTRCQAAAEARADIGDYACSMTMTMPGGDLSPAENDYYLQVTPIYRDTRISVRMSQNDAPRLFDGAQPKIDSTGKAADVFRRIEARIAFPEVPFSQPRYGVEVGDNICKQFQVTESPAGFYNPSPGTTKCFDPAGPPICSGSNDIVMVLDKSGSMRSRWNTGTRLEKLQEVASNFIRNTGVDEEGNHVSLVSFSTEGMLDIELGFDQDALIGIINNLQTEDSTRYLEGIRFAEQELSSERIRAESPQVMIFISDGEPHDDKREILARTNALKDSGVAVYSVAISSEDDGFDEQLMMDMAGNGGLYANADSEAALEAVLEAISANLRC